MPDDTSLHHCLKNKQLKLSSNDPDYGHLGGVWLILAHD